MHPQQSCLPIPCLRRTFDTEELVERVMGGGEDEGTKRPGPAPADGGIQPATSDRICRHMNDDHASTCHAIVMESLSAHQSLRCSVKNARMKSIDLTGYSLTFVLCDGSSCSMETVRIPFDPPLKCSAEARPRLVAAHHRALSPKVAWLVIDPLMRTIFGVCILLGLGTFIGREALTALIDDTPWALSLTQAVFGSSSFFARCVIWSWYFSLAAHTIEAIYTAYQCRTKLKLGTLTTMKWFLLNVVTGFPIMRKVTEFVSVDRDAKLKT